MTWQQQFDSAREQFLEALRIRPTSAQAHDNLGLVCRQGDDRKRALAIPLSGSEWRIGPSDSVVQESADGCLVFSSSGAGRLYAPLWLDFQKRRF